MGDTRITGAQLRAILSVGLFEVVDPVPKVGPGCNVDAHGAKVAFRVRSSRVMLRRKVGPGCQYDVKTGTLYCKVPKLMYVSLRHMTKETAASTAQMRKGVLELCILRVLRQGEAYTSDIVAALAGRRPFGGRGDHLPFAYPHEKCRDLDLSMGRKPLRAAPRKYYSMTSQGKSSSMKWRRHGINLWIP